MNKSFTKLVVNDNQMEEIYDLSVEYPYCMVKTEMRNFVNHTIVWHWHEELELGIVKKGSVRIYTGEKSYLIKAGEGYLVNSNVMNMKISEEVDNPAECFDHLFHSTFICGHFHSIFETKYMNPILKNHSIDVIVFKKTTESGKKILHFMDELEKLQYKKDTEFQTRNVLSEIWLQLLVEASNLKPQNSGGALGQGRLQNMVSFIHQHFAEKISLQDIAQSANISTREAARCFKKIRDKSPIDYLVEYRLSRAKQMLVDTDESITNIAMMCGFSDSTYFGKMFKREFGMTPKEARK